MFPACLHVVVLQNMVGAVALDEDIYSHSNYTHMWDEVDAQYCVCVVSVHVVRLRLA